MPFCCVPLNFLFIAIKMLLKKKTYIEWVSERERVQNGKDEEKFVPHI